METVIIENYINEIANENAINNRIWAADFTKFIQVKVSKTHEFHQKLKR